MTEQTPEPTPEEPETPVEQDPPEEEAPPQCTSVYPRDEAITCELFDGHFAYRLPHTRHTDGTVYEWE